MARQPQKRKKKVRVMNLQYWAFIILGILFLVVVPLFVILNR